MNEISRQEVLKTLEGVAELFKNRKKWAQGGYAYDAHYVHVGPSNRAAVCFCLLGAVRKVAPPIAKFHPMGVLYLVENTENTLADALPSDNTGANTDSLVSFNDAEGRTVEDIRELVSKAIEGIKADASNT